MRPIKLLPAFLLAGGFSATAATPEVRLPEKHFALLENYCLDCHDGDTQKGKIDLEALPFSITTIEQAELWQKVLNAMNSGEMPPENKKQPKGPEKADFLSDLADTMVFARKALSDSGGKVTMRRLNRREYQNTIEDLLGFRVDASSLPADGGGNTFDTEGASMFISSDQIEQYLKLGRRAIDEMFARRASHGQEAKTFRVEPEETVNVKHLEDIRRMEEKYKQVKPWMDAVDKAVKAPENQAVMEQLRKEFPDIDKHSYRIYRVSKRLKGVPDPEHFGGDPDSAMNFYQLSYNDNYPSLKHYAGLPHNDRGTYLRLTSGVVRLDISPPKNELPPGKYRLRFRVGRVEGSPPERHFIEVGHPQRRNQVPADFASAPLSTHQVTGTIENPQVIETTVEIGADTPKEFGIQEKQIKDYGARKRNHYAAKRKNGHGNPPALWVDWIELKGPISENAVMESTITRVEPEKTINPANEAVIKQTEARQERFKQWKKGVDEAAKSPENQAIIAEIRKKDHLIDHPNRFYTFAEHFKGVPDPRDFGFPDCKKAAAADPSRSRSLALHKHYASLPHRDRGTYLKLTHGTGRVIVAPKKMPPGNYVMRVRVGAVKDAPSSRRFIQVGHPQRQIEIRDWGLEGPAISTHQVTGTIEDPETIEIPLQVGTDTTKEFAIQEKQPNNGSLKALWNAHNELKAKNGYGHPPAIWIDWVELEGPLPKVEITQSKTYRVEAEKVINPKNEKAIKGMEEIYARFKQWQKGVDEAAKTPENQAIIQEIAKKEKHILHPLRFYRFADRLKGTPDARDFGFPEANAPQTANPQWPSTYQYLRHYASLPHRDSGAYLKPTKGTGRVIVSPEKLPIGNYTLRVRVGVVEGSDPSRHFIQVGHPQRMYGDTGVKFDHGLEGQAISTHHVSGTVEKPEVIEVPLEVRSDKPREFAVQEKQPNNGKIQALWKTFNAAKQKNGYGIPPAIWVDWVELEGPHGTSGSNVDTEEWWVSESTDPNEASRVRTILGQFAYKAFRGVEAEEKFIYRLVSIFKNRRQAGEPFDTAIRLPLSIILASPGFLYFNEPNDADESRELNDRELAVRLAYFLWSAPPDQELLDLASQGELSKPDILQNQVNRLIADTRSDEFVSGFLHQWLDMERLDFFQFDTTLHREFDESTRSAARKEVYHSFAHLLRDSEAGRLGKLLKSDYVYINGLLANYYGIDGVTGNQFQKVALPAKSPRGGLLGMAAIHAMGSDGIESSPVERGAWVLRHLLNDPPPPAPPNVPQLSRLADKPLTTREKLMAHQEQPQCASCHRKIDPIGFGLENFDAAGKWRTTEVNGKGKDRNVHNIDPSGAFHNGPAFADYFELRDRITEREEDFARGFTEHLIGYGLGRPFGFTDKDLADEIMAAAKEEGFNVSGFVQALVRSKPFQIK